MLDISQLAQVLAAGLTNGAIYALAALGFSLVFSVSGFLNLVQGEFVVLSGLLTIALTEWFGVPLIPAIAAAIAGCTICAAMFQHLTLSPKRRLSPDAALMVTLGGAFVFRGTAMILFGRDAQALPSFSGERPIVIGDIAIATQSLWIFGTLAASTLLLWLFFEKTYAGKAMQACSQSSVGAALVGIEIKRVSLLAFMLSAALGAVAGVVVAPLNFVTFDDGLGISIKGFIAAVIGGLGSYPGSVAGGIILGVAESLGAAFISSEFKDLISFAALLLLLLLRPNGFFQKS